MNKITLRTTAQVRFRQLLSIPNSAPLQSPVFGPGRAGNDISAWRSRGSEALIDLSRKRLFLFDLDGVLTAGKESPVKLGGPKVINKIRASKGKRFFVVTNDSTDTVETVLERLVRFNIPVKYDEILTSAKLTAQYIAKRHPK